MLSEDKFTEVEEKQANTSVKQAEQDRRRRQNYGSERKTSQYFRKDGQSKTGAGGKITEAKGKQANTSVKMAEQECRQRKIKEEAEYLEKVDKKHKDISALLRSSLQFL